ncbi:GNAT family N-acetyltransferase [Microvirga sp. ACRRW]|uniref:GNAT family N-acetyltransferase n=1 Tax=Microvirga sp. ACRRW TaxID=2918205 RepID=UPI001EF45426|nr:GNAT family N-acetyltransferase [Microvirga sp. ACRRW]MCG7392802.1 GNAT family N-acetyltransferase [Microvirga sp. ACRRW]
MFSFQPLTPDTDGFDALLHESLSEGHGMLQRLQENWRNGTNRFLRPGEILLGAFDGRSLIGICGRNIDPYSDNPKAGRVRHLYVARSGRRQGAGYLLVTAIIDGATPSFDHLNARAPESAFPFYERLGFTRVEADPFVTHRLRLKI